MGTELPRFDPEKYTQEVEATLRLHAHHMGVYYKALLDAGIPGTVAGDILIAWQRVTIEAETNERLQRREFADRRLRAGRF